MPAGQIITEKDSTDRKKRPRVSQTVKIAAWIGVASLMSGILLYVYLFAMRQTASRQNAWFLSFILWLVFEIVIVSSFLVLIKHVLLPSVVTQDMRRVSEKVIADIATFQARETSRYTILTKGTDSGQYARSQQQRHAATFNAAKYFFSSCRIAKLYPELPLSEVIGAFSTPWPNWSMTHMRQNLSSSYSRKGSFVTQAASRMLLFLLVGLLKVPGAVQDVLIQLFVVSGMGSLFILMLRLHEYSPGLVVVPVVAVIICVFVMTTAWKSSALESANKVIPLDSNELKGPQSVESGAKIRPLQVDQPKGRNRMDEVRSGGHEELAVTLNSQEFGGGGNSGVVSHGLSRNNLLAPLPPPSAHSKKKKKRRLKQQRKVQPVLSSGEYYASPKRLARESSVSDPASLCLDDANDGDVEDDFSNLTDHGKSSGDECVSNASLCLPRYVPPSMYPLIEAAELSPSQSLPTEANEGGEHDSRAPEGPVIIASSNASHIGIVTDEVEDKIERQMSKISEKLIAESEKSSLRVAQILEERMSALEKVLLSRQNTINELPQVEKTSVVDVLPTVEKEERGTMISTSRRDVQQSAEAHEHPPTSLSDEISRYFFQNITLGDEPDTSVQWAEPDNEFAAGHWVDYDSSEEKQPEIGANGCQSNGDDELLVDLHKKLSDMSNVVEVFRQRSQAFRAFDVQHDDEHTNVGEITENEGASYTCANLDATPVVADEGADWLVHDYEAAHDPGGSDDCGMSEDDKGHFRCNFSDVLDHVGDSEGQHSGNESLHGGSGGKKPSARCVNEANRDNCQTPVFQRGKSGDIDEYGDLSWDRYKELVDFNSLT